MHRPALIAVAVAVALLAALPACKLQDQDPTPLDTARREAALEACLRMMRSDNPAERVAGARELGRPDLADERAFATLGRLLRDDPDPRVRRHAAFALRAGAYARATVELLDAVQLDPDQAVRRDALRALGFRRDPAALPVFELVLGNRRETAAIRGEAARALGALRSRDAAHLLCRAVAFEHSTGPVREELLDQLAEQGFVAVSFFLEFLGGQGFVIAEAVVEEMRRDDPDGVMARLVHAYRQKTRAAGDRFARGQLFP